MREPADALIELSPAQRSQLRRHGVKRLGAWAIACALFAFYLAMVGDSPAILAVKLLIFIPLILAVEAISVIWPAGAVLDRQAFLGILLQSITIAGLVIVIRTNPQADPANLLSVGLGSGIGYLAARSVISLWINRSSSTAG